MDIAFSYRHGHRQGDRSMGRVLDRTQKGVNELSIRGKPSVNQNMHALFNWEHQLKLAGIDMFEDLLFSNIETLIHLSTTALIAARLQAL
jgi:hypothetical protein